MLWVAASLCFFLRSGEVNCQAAENAFDPSTHITFEDLSVDNESNPRVAKLSLKAAGHSFRIGVATTARACGLNDSTIQMLGRWSS